MSNKPRKRARAGTDNTAPVAASTARPKPSDAPVIAPNVLGLPSLVKPTNQQRSVEAREKRWRNSCAIRARKWATLTPSFTLANVDLSELDKRKKNNLKDRKHATDTMKAMKDFPPDAGSGRWYDKNGKLILAAFADHVIEKLPLQSGASGPNTVSQVENSGFTASRHLTIEQEETTTVYKGPGCLTYSVSGRTESDIEAARARDPAAVIQFGLDITSQNQVQAATQLLQSVLHPVAHPRDLRHEYEQVLELSSLATDVPEDDSQTSSESSASSVTTSDSEEAYASSDKNDESDYSYEGDQARSFAESPKQYFLRSFLKKAKDIEFLRQHIETYNDKELKRPGVDRSGREISVFERTGVSHLVHAWHAQGRTRNKDPLVPSADMCKGSLAAMAVKYYFQATANVAILLDEYFEGAFPQEHIRYKEAFAAGVWLLEDPGPWLGRALVYKLQVKAHQDRLDGGPTAIFNVGQYTGGDLYMTCLGLKFSYRPGHVFIFLAGSVYHAVGHWTPSGGTSAEGITPGRIGHVFFSPLTSLQKLDKRPALWRNNTFSGLWPSNVAARPVKSK